MTSDQETRVLAMLSAFEAGKKISELDTASGSVSDMRIEVLDTDGESKVMNLSEAVTTAANAVCGRYWNESNSTYRVSLILYGALPAMSTMVLFIVLLGVFAIGAPGVPGGTVIASLGIVISVLGFDETGTALLLTIFALQDSFGTACNVTGDGALTLILSKLDK